MRRVIAPGLSSSRGRDETRRRWVQQGIGRELCLIDHDSIDDMPPSSCCATGWALAEGDTAFGMICRIPRGLPYNIQRPRVSGFDGFHSILELFREARYLA